MRTLSIALIGFVLILCACKKEPKTEPEKEKSVGSEISFYTPDSIQIFGDLYELDRQGKTILLFHQGGSNARGEYAPIIPKLIKEGYNILAIDQRVGGQFYGSYNRTLANIPTNGFDDGYGYCDAYNNLETALDFIMEAGFTGDKIIWGSSYSAALAIHLAHNRQQDINAVLAFSPASGNAVKDCLPNKYFETIKIPLLLLRPPHEMERENSKAQSDLAKTHGHQTYVPKSGVHGSSMLVAERVGSQVDDTWKVVLSFIKKI
ncbi:alpha/beta hydrolase [Flagellimonas flava]|uniref:Serine aminopeptidase S33 domain-containing protein n=1 Tax=Flagellimonas flava TaxID=570519 RepID=A0A1M5IKR0_9FLAO|nr:hypothetical protein [Allomuricauda flava]SHG28510.1 hypothetical protein SAMN04488116_0753 [Allomuricauda flava]